MNHFPFCLLLVFNLWMTNVFSQETSDPKYIRVGANYLMVLKQGDSLFSELETFARREKIPSANFSGMGFVNVEFGFFNFAKKLYKKRKFDDLELGALIGSIAWQNGQPSIHTHGIGAGSDFRARAGHILSAVVSTGSLELLITPHEQKLERVKDENLGANILRLED